MTDVRTYRGSCQCGAVAFEATADLAKIISCNCSRCARLGWLVAFVPTSRFRLLSGTDALAECRFDTRSIAHPFCRTCGIEPFARGKAPDGADMVALNVRRLEAGDPDALTPTKVDGRSR